MSGTSDLVTVGDFQYYPPFTFRFRKWPLSLMIYDENLVRISHIVRAACPDHFILFDVGTIVKYFLNFLLPYRSTVLNVLLRTLSLKTLGLCFLLKR